MTQAKENLDSHVLSRPDIWMTWRRHGIPCVDFILILRLEPTRNWFDNNYSGQCFKKIAGTS